jgi:hypothetical protein
MDPTVLKDDTPTATQIDLLDKYTTMAKEQEEKLKKSKRALKKELDKLQAEMFTSAPNERDSSTNTKADRMAKNCVVYKERIKRIMEYLEELNTAKACLENGDTSDMRASWVWMKNEDLFENIPSNNGDKARIKGQYVVATHPGSHVTDVERLKYVAGMRLMAVASMAFIDQDSVLVSVSLVTFLDGVWRAAIPAKKGPLGRIVKLTKGFISAEHYTNVVKDVEIGLNE